MQHIVIQDLGHKIQTQNVFQIDLLEKEKLTAITACSLGKSLYKLYSSGFK